MNVKSYNQGMNVIFTVIIIASALVLAIANPESASTALMSGAQKSITLSVTLLGVYSLWLGTFSIAEKSGITEKLAKLLVKPVRLVFGKTDSESEKYIVLNVSANLLGLGGVATPAGINAASTLEKSGNTYAQTMLFVVAATSLQLFPASVIALRSSFGSQSPSDIVFPTLLATLVSTLLGIALTKLLVKK